MTKYEEIKELYLDVRKAKDKISTAILCLLIGELDTDIKRGKDVTDEVVIAKIKKMIENNNICLESADNDTKLKLEMENACLENFLPKQLTDDELMIIVSHCNPSNIGEGMKFLKDKYAGLYDGKTANVVIREFLS